MSSASDASVSRKRSSETCREEKAEEDVAPASSIRAEADVETVASRRTRPCTRTLVLPVIRADHRACKLVCDAEELPADMLLAAIFGSQFRKVKDDIYMYTPLHESSMREQKMYSLECTDEDVLILQRKAQLTCSNQSLPPSSAPRTQLMWFGQQLGWMLESGNAKYPFSFSLVLYERVGDANEVDVYLIHSGSGPVREVLFCEFLRETGNRSSHFQLPQQGTIYVPYANNDFAFAPKFRVIDMEWKLTRLHFMMPLRGGQIEQLPDAWKPFLVHDRIQSDIHILMLPAPRCSMTPFLQSRFFEAKAEEVGVAMWRHGMSSLQWDAPAELQALVQTLMPRWLNNVDSAPTRETFHGQRRVIALSVKDPGVYCINHVPPELVLESIEIDDFWLRDVALHEILQQPICVNESLVIVCYARDETASASKPMPICEVGAHLSGPGIMVPAAPVTKYSNLTPLPGDIYCARSSTFKLLTSYRKRPQVLTGMPMDFGITRNYIQDMCFTGTPSMCPRWRQLQFPLELHVTRMPCHQRDESWCAMYAVVDGRRMSLVSEPTAALLKRATVVLWARRAGASEAVEPTQVPAPAVVVRDAEAAAAAPAPAPAVVASSELSEEGHDQQDPEDPAV